MKTRGTVCGAWIIAGLCSGCLSPEGGIPEGSRLIRASVHVKGGATATERRAMQGVAVYAAAECAEGILVSPGVCAIFGEPFDPVMGDEELKVLAPCGTSVNLVIQTLGSSEGRTPGELVAIVAFASGNGNEQTSLIPREIGSALAPACRDTELLATNLIDLGEVAVPASGVEVVVVGGPEGGTNPLATVDTDGDETPNLLDPDDDGDGAGVRVILVGMRGRRSSTSSASASSAATNRRWGSTTPASPTSRRSAAIHSRDGSVYTGRRRST
jgi:hypothetical protein